MAIIDSSVVGNPGVEAGEEFEAQVRKFRNHYDELIKTLGELGTEVSRRLTEEIDLDIAPNNFVRDGVHHFIFPPQPECVLIDHPESGVIEGTEPYTLTRVHKACQYDEDLVEGEIIVTYDDSASTPVFSVTDGLGPETSIVPVEVELAVVKAIDIE